MSFFSVFCLSCFIFSCRVPRLAWRHLRWSRRSPYRTCSSPGCCTCRSQTCWRWWWWNWQTCRTQTWECSDRWIPSRARSLARWPRVRGRPRYCRSGSDTMRKEGFVIFVSFLSFQAMQRNMYTTLPSWMVTTSGRPPATRARSVKNNT